MNFFGRLVSSLTGSSTPVPNFDFDFKLGASSTTDLDANVVQFDGTAGLRWTMQNGTRLNSDSSSSSSNSSGGGGEEKQPVTIFSCIIPDAGSMGERLLRNVLKRARGLVLPGVLRTYASIEHDGKAYFATERCTPLRKVAADPFTFYRGNNNSNVNANNSNNTSGSPSKAKKSSWQDEDEDDDSNNDVPLGTDDASKFEVAVAVGLGTVAGALAAMHKNNLFHGNVNIDSIFALTDSGEWRLFGLEFVATVQDIVDSNTPFQSASSILLPHRLAPEFGGIGGSGGGRGGAHGVAASAVPLADAWGLGVLLLEVFLKNQAPPTNTSELRAPKCVPRNFVSAYTSLMCVSNKARWSITRFLAEAEILHGGCGKAVSLVAALDELSLKDGADRDTYYRELAAVIPTIPDRLAQGLVLPKISHQLQYGGGCSAAALGPLLQVARNLRPEIFAVRVSPAVLVMFSSQEPLVRMKLLESSDAYAKLLPTKLVCERIWPLYLQGLTSKIPEIRELSVRALPNFAPVLTERFESGDVPKAILALQQDPQGAIRTNATICLGMLAKYLPAESRGKTLCNGLGRMLKDPYPASRAAAVRTIGSLVAHGVGDEELFKPDQLCEQLLPALCPLLLDPDRNARDAATTSVQELLKHAISSANSVPCTAPAAAPSTPAAASQQHNRSVSGATPATATSAASTPAAARSPVVPNSNTASTSSSGGFPFGSASKLTATAAASSPAPAPVPVAPPNSSSSSSKKAPAVSSDPWDDIEFTIAPGKSSAASSSTTATTQAAAAVPPPVKRGFSSSGLSSLGNTMTTTTTTNLDEPFTLAPSKPAAVAQQQQQQQQQQQPAVAQQAQASPPAPPVVDLSASSAGMKLGGAKKRGFAPKSTSQQ